MKRNCQEESDIEHNKKFKSDTAECNKTQSVVMGTENSKLSADKGERENYNRDTIPETFSTVSENSTLRQSLEDNNDKKHASSDNSDDVSDREMILMGEEASKPLDEIPPNLPSSCATSSTSIDKTMINVNKKKRKFIEKATVNSELAYVNRTCKIHQNYYCFLCEKQLMGGNEAVLHFQESNHIKRQVEAGPVTNLNDKNHYFKVINEGCIAGPKGTFKCRMCDKSIPTYEHVILHNKTAEHLKKRLKFVAHMQGTENIENSGDTSSDEDSAECTSKIAKVTPEEVQIIEPCFRTLFVNHTCKFGKIWYCFLCAESFSALIDVGDHFAKIKHRNQSRSTDQVIDSNRRNAYNRWSKHGYVPGRNKTIDCKVCGKNNVKVEDIGNHTGSLIHLKNRAIFRSNMRMIKNKEDFKDSDSDDDSTDTEKPKSTVIKNRIPDFTSQQISQSEIVPVRENLEKYEYISNRQDISDCEKISKLEEIAVRPDHSASYTVSNASPLCETVTTANNGQHKALKINVHNERTLFSNHTCKFGKIWYCFLCAESFGDLIHVHIHFKTSKHQNRKKSTNRAMDRKAISRTGYKISVKNGCVPGRNGTIECKICGGTNVKVEDIKIHSFTAMHLGNIRIFVEKMKTITNEEGFQDSDSDDDWMDAEEAKSPAIKIERVKKDCRGDEISESHICNRIPDFASQQTPQSEIVPKTENLEKLEYVYNQQDISDCENISKSGEIVVRPEKPGSDTFSNANLLCETITTAYNERYKDPKIFGLYKKILFRNHTCKFGKTWYCFLCAKSFGDSIHVDVHFETTDHQNRRESTDPAIDIEDVFEKAYKISLKHGYVPGRNGKIECKICGGSNVKVEDIRSHSLTGMHRKNRAMFIKNMKTITNEQIQQITAHDKKTLFSNHTCKFGETWYCFLCAESFSDLIHLNVHFKTTYHRNRQESAGRAIDIEGISRKGYKLSLKHGYIPGRNGTIQCKICDGTNVNVEDIKNHSLTAMHRENRIIFIENMKMIENEQGFQDSDSDDDSINSGKPKSTALEIDRVKEDCTRDEIPETPDFTLQQSSESKDVKQEPEQSEYISNEQNISENNSISSEEIAVQPDYPASNASSLCETITTKKNEERNGLNINATDSKVLFFNHTCKFDKGWYCFLCAKTLIEMSCLGPHFEEADHQSLLKMAGETVESEHYKSYRRLVLQGYTPGRDGSIDCIMCDTKGLKTCDMKGHINSQKHQTKLATFRAEMKVLQNAKSFRDKESEDDSTYSEESNFKIVGTHSEKRKHNSDENSGFHISSERTFLLTSASKIAVEKKDDSNQKIIITEKDVVSENIPDFITLFHNHTCKFGANYYCFMCEETFISLCAVVSHFKDTDHQQRVNAALPSFNLSDKADSISSELLVTEGFSPSLGALHTMIECRICDYTCAVSYFEKHIESRSHVTKRVKFSANIVKYKKNVEIELSNLIEASPSESNKTVPALEDSKTNEIVFASNIRLPQTTEKNNEKVQNVTASKISVQEQKTEKTTRSKTSFDEKISSAQLTSSNEQREETIAYMPSSTDEMFFANYIIRLNPAFYCFLCEKTFPRHCDAISHINESDHKNRKQITLPEIRALPKTYASFIDRGLVPGEKLTVDCKMCGITGLEVNMINEHCRSTSHKETKLKFIAGVTESGEAREKLTSNPGESTLKMKEQVAAITEEIPQSKETIQGYCSICIVDVVDVSRHNEEPDHKRYLDSFNTAFINLGQQIWCKKCNCKIEWSSIKYHAEMHELSPWYKTIPKDDNETLFNNYISKYGTIYYCFICEKSFDHWDKVVLHIKAIGHKKYMESTDQSIDPTMPKCSYRIDEGIVPGQHKLVDCRLCRISFLEGFDISLHLKTTDHIRKKTKFIADLKKSVENKDSPDLENQNPNISSVVTQALSIQEIENQTAMNKNCSEKSKDFVGKQETGASSSKTSIKENFCDAESTSNDKQCEQTVTENTIATAEMFFANYTVKLNPIYYCFLCDKPSMNGGDATAHINESDHQDRKRIACPSAVGWSPVTYLRLIDRGLMPGGRNRVDCRMCGITGVNFSDIDIHCRSARHRNARREFTAAVTESIEKQEKLTFDFPNEVMSIDADSVSVYSRISELRSETKPDAPETDGIIQWKGANEGNCLVCVVDLDDVSAHLSGTQHKQYLRCFNWAFSVVDRQVWCRLCNCNFEWSAIKSHGKMHKLWCYGGAKPDNKTLFDNYIFHHRSTYYCFLCEEIFPTWSHLVPHFGDIGHQHRTKINGQPIGLTKNEYSVTTKQGFVPGYNKTIDCRLCCIGGFNIEDLKMQPHSIEHVYNKAKFLTRIGEDGDSEISEDEDRDAETVDTGKSTSSIEDRITKKTIFRNYTSLFPNGLYCFLCEKIIKSWKGVESHFQEMDHQMRRIEEVRRNPPTEEPNRANYSVLITHGLVPWQRKKLACKICSKNSVKGYMDHIKANTHVENLAHFVVTFKNQKSQSFGGEDFNSESSKKPCNLDETLDQIRREQTMITNFAQRNVTVEKEIEKNYSDLTENVNVDGEQCTVAPKTSIIKKVAFNNHTIKARGRLYCCLCEILFNSWDDAALHFNDIDHQNRRDKIGRINQKLGAGQYYMLISNGFVPGPGKTMNCTVCDETGFTKVNFINHIKLPVHLKNISTGKIGCWKKENQLTDSDSIDNKPSRSKPTNAETPKNIHVPYNRNMICNFNLQEEEMMEKTNSEKDPKDAFKTPLADVTGLSNKSESCIYIEKTDGKKSFCHICSETQFTVATHKIDIHIKSPGHCRALTRYGCDKVIRTSNGTYYCICCECGLSSRASVYLHVKDKKHISSLVKVCTGQKVSTGTRRNETPKISDDFSSSHNSREFRRSSIPSNFGGDTNNAQSRTISDGINCPSQSWFDNYVAQQNVEIAAPQKTENSCNASGGRKNTKQSELSTMMSSIASELSRFILSYDTPAEKNTNKRKHHNIKNKAEEKMAKKVKCPCSPCNFVAQDITQLHIHMATHYAEEFVDRPRNFNDDCILPTCIGGDQIPLAMNSNEPESDAEKIVDNVDNFSVCSEHSFSDSSDSPSSAVETRKSIKRTRKERRAEAKFKDVMKHLEFKDDYIYDLDDKLADLELGMALGLVIDSSNMYCLICRKLVENTVDNYTEHLRDIDHCNYLDEMETDDAQFAELDEQYSDLDLAQEYIEEISEDTVRCIVCEEDIANNNSSLGAHINHEIHERKCEDTQAIARRRFEETKLGINCDWYSIEKYWCVPCKMKTSSEVSFVEHLGKKNHAKTIRHPDRSGKRMMFDYCPYCAVLWYGYRCTHYYHINSDTHKWLERDGFYTLPSLPIRAKKLMVTSLEEIIDKKIQNYDRKEKAEQLREKQLIGDLKKQVKMKFSVATPHPFGSRVSRLGTLDSDYDIFLDCLNMYDGKHSNQERIVSLINIVHHCLKENPKVWNIEKLLTTCRSPIIKACHRPTGLACDISVGNGLAVENTYLIRSYNKIFPMCRKMTLFLKQWSQDCDLSGTDRFTSYTLCWLVIFYLQKESILPSVATLIEMHKKSRVIAGWETGVADNFKYNKKLGNHTMKEFLTRFFRYYSEFDFRKDVASPLIGDVIKKQTFTNSQNLPEEMERYKLYMLKNRDSEAFRIDSPMCLQDPFDLQHNLTKAIKKVYLNRFRKCCVQSLELISSL